MVTSPVLSSTTLQSDHHHCRYILGSPLDFSQHRGGIFLQNEKKFRSSSSKLTITK